MQRTDFSKGDPYLKPIKSYNEDTKLEYELSNDYKNLFFYFRTTNSETLSKILLMGLHINIETSENKSNEINITYPIPDDDIANQSSTGKKLMGSQELKSINKNQFLLQHNEIMLKGCKPPIGDNSISLKNKYGIKVNFDWDSTNTLIYKLVLPFRTFYKDSLTLSDSSKVFNVLVKVNAIPKPEEPLNSKKSGGLNGGGHGSGSRGGGTNENNTEGSDGKTTLYESASFKLKVKCFIFY